ncbi:MAG: mannonate dehydratase [Pseudomonadota bacterium]
MTGKNHVSRRALLAASGAALALPALDTAALAYMPNEGPDTPKICLGPVVDSEMNPRGFKRFRQIGITHVIMGNSGFPWKADDLKARVALLKAGELTPGDIVLPYVGPAREIMRDIILGREGRPQSIEIVKGAIRAAGEAGIPVVEYNFYAHRLEEGYFHAPDPTRGGAVVESFHYDRVKDLPPLPETGRVSADRLWSNLEFFLKAVVPVAESVNVRLSLHPNDPPPPVSRGSAQIMTTFKDWQQLVGLVNSPSNGMTYDCGVSYEIGEDPVAVARWLGARDRISHCHYRNVVVRKPIEDYTEVWPDNGMVDMLAVMKELVRQKYPRMVHPEHARGLNVNDGVTETLRDPAGERGTRLAADTDPNLNSYAAWAYHAAYTRAMLQAALLTR